MKARAMATWPKASQSVPYQTKGACAEVAETPANARANQTAIGSGMLPPARKSEPRIRPKIKLGLNGNGGEPTHATSPMMKIQVQTNRRLRSREGRSMVEGYPRVPTGNGCVAVNEAFPGRITG